MKILRSGVLASLLLFISTAYAHPNKGWVRYCRTHHHCLIKHPWTNRTNPIIRHNKWRIWCEKNQRCLSKFGYSYLTGYYGSILDSEPAGKGNNLIYFMDYHGDINPTTLLAISQVESSGGETATAYLGCLDSATFGSWPGQIQCAVGVLDRCGFACYNSSNPNYGAEVESVASQISISRRIR